MLNFIFIIYGNIDQISGGYYYDREFIQAIKNRGHSVSIMDAKRPADTNINPDIYIIDELCHPDFYRKHSFKKLKPGIPLAAMVHHLASDEDLPVFLKYKHLFMERSFFRKINFAVFNSNNTYKSAAVKAGYKGPYSIAVPGKTVQSAYNISNKKTPERLSLLFIGNLISRKCIHHVIINLAQIRNIPFRLTIAGNMDADLCYSERILNLISKLNLSSKIELRGYVSEAEKERLLNESDVLLMPSSHEGFGIAYIEAMKYGTIPVAGISGGASEIIQNGENGFLINPESTSDLHSVLSILWEKPSERELISRYAVKTWNEHPSWEQTFQTTIDELEKLKAVI